MPVASPPIAWPELAELLGQDGLRPATASDAVAGVAPHMVAAPPAAAALARGLGWAHAAGLKVVPRGGGTKLGWGNPPTACDLVLSSRRLDRVLEHAWADMTVVVQAGCRVADLQKALAEHGQHLALDPLWPERATVGGILSTNDSGTLRLRHGSLRDLVIGITVALADGTLARSGGKVVKNVAGYDLPKLFTGALGTLGVIVEAVFRLHPLPRETQSVSFGGTTEALNATLLAILASRMTPTGLQLRVAPAGARLDVRFAGTSAGIQAQVDQVMQLAGTPLTPSEVPADAWTAHQAIWDGDPSALLAKLSVLPTRLSAVCAVVERLAAARSLRWRVVLQGVGVGYVRLEGDEPALRATLLSLRDELTSAGGTLVVLACPAAVQQDLDVWGPPSDAQPVMARLKQRFDPDRTLNPGRFLGGI
jgi:glycolate oxidase FAD binding subunit